MTAERPPAPVFTRGRGAAGAPLLLCLHGIGTTGDSFADQLDLGGADLRVVAWDAPGYGRSADPVVGAVAGATVGSESAGMLFGLDDWADAAAALIIELSPASAATVLGVSWGGVIATRLALRHPELVDALVLADSSVGSAWNAAEAAGLRGRVAVLRTEGLAAFAAARAPLLVTRHAPTSLVDRIEQLMIAGVRPAGFASACESLASTDHTPRLGEITAPTLVICGADDRVTPLADSERLAASIPGAELVVVADAGHLANQERPREFNAAVVDFLGRVRRPSGVAEPS